LVRERIYKRNKEKAGHRKNGDKPNSGQGKKVLQDRKRKGERVTLGGGLPTGGGNLPAPARYLEREPKAEKEKGDLGGETPSRRKGEQ